MPAGTPSATLRCIKDFIQCIQTAVANILVILTPTTVQEDVIEAGAGAGNVAAGWVSVTLINQGDTNVTITSGTGGILLPGTTVRFDLKGFANTGDQIDYTVAAGTAPSLLIVEVR